MCTIYFNHIHTYSLLQLFPETPSPTSHLLLKTKLKFNHWVQIVHGAFYWTTIHLSRITFLTKTCSSFPCSHQRSGAWQLGVGDHAQFYSPYWNVNWLHIYYEFMSVQVWSRQDTVSPSPHGSWNICLLFLLFFELWVTLYSTVVSLFITRSLPVEVQGLD